MSRAFIKETDETVENLPDRPISSHPNMVTPKGFELIESALSRFAPGTRAGAERQRPGGHGPHRPRSALLDFPAFHCSSGSPSERYRLGALWLRGDDRPEWGPPRDLPHRW